MNQFKHAKWWRSYLDKLKQAFSYTKSSQQKAKSKEKQREAKRSKKKQRGKQRTTAAVFFGTFGALHEVHFLHAIYHFKSQEVKNPTLQTVYDLELKWGRYGLRKTTAPGVCEIFAQHLPNSHTPLHGANFPLFLPTPHEIFSFGYFCINFHSSPCNPPIIRFLS